MPLHNKRFIINNTLFYKRNHQRVVSTILKIASRSPHYVWRTTSPQRPGYISTDLTKIFLTYTDDIHHISTAQNITSVSTRHAIQVAATQTPTTHHIGINTFRCRAIRNTPPPVSDYPASVLPAPQHRGNSPEHHSGMSPRHRQYAGCHSPVTTATQRPK